MSLERHVLLLAASDEIPYFKCLEASGFTVSVTQNLPELKSLALDIGPGLILVNLALVPIDEQRDLLQHCKDSQIPVISIISSNHEPAIDPFLAVDDFIFHPTSDTEMKARINRALWKNGSWDTNQIIRVGDLTIDQERYDITVDGRRVILTFKEYQLLCLLATNEGRVYTREQLLRRIWGYDYFGGTRTVDVHIRRLRSKLEDAGHLFIETVRNVGYRFRIH